MSESSWTKYDSDSDDDESRILFDLPATDPELVDQVIDFLDENPNAVVSEMLLKMARKYRFAGYIGSIDYLFDEIEELKENVKELSDTNEALKEEISVLKRTSWSLYINNFFRW
jgi:hypothetical protein